MHPWSEHFIKIFCLEYIKFKSNLNKMITINNETKLPYYSSPSSIESLQLITTTFFLNFMKQHSLKAESMVLHYLLSDQ